MKLLFCTNCYDIISLKSEERRCQCGTTGGKYLDDLMAEYWGDNAVPLGISNPSFVAALTAGQPVGDKGLNFEAFIMPKDCETFKKINKRGEK